MRKFWILCAAFCLPVVARATVTGTASTVSFTCTSSTGPFAFTFPVDDVGALVVIDIPAGALPGVMTILPTSAWTATPVNNSYANGGSVTLVNPCATGDTLTIARATETTQLTHYTQYMPALYTSFENGLDQLTTGRQDTYRVDQVHIGQITGGGTASVTYTPLGQFLNVNFPVSSGGSVISSTCQNAAYLAPSGSGIGGNGTYTTGGCSAGSSTGGIAEALAACAAAGNTQCSIQQTADITITSPQTITPTVGVWFNSAGHKITCTNSSGICLTWDGTTADGLYPFKWENVTVDGTGSTGSGIELLNFTKNPTLSNIHVQNFATVGAGGTAGALCAEFSNIEGGSIQLATTYCYNSAWVTNNSNKTLWQLKLVNSGDQAKVDKGGVGLRVDNGTSEGQFFGSIQNHYGSVSLYIGDSTTNMANNQFSLHFEDDGTASATDHQIYFANAGTHTISNTRFIGNLFNKGTLGTSSYVFGAAANPTSSNLASTTVTSSTYGGMTVIDPAEITNAFLTASADPAAVPGTAGAPYVLSGNDGLADIIVQNLVFQYSGSGTAQISSIAGGADLQVTNVGYFNLLNGYFLSSGTNPTFEAIGGSASVAPTLELANTYQSQTWGLVSGTSGTSDFLLQNSTHSHNTIDCTSNATASSENCTFSGTVTGSLGKFNGVSNSSSTTLTAGAAAGSSPTIACATSYLCGWNAGRVNLLTGGSATTGALFTNTDSVITHAHIPVCQYWIYAANSSYVPSGTTVTTGFYPSGTTTVQTLNMTAGLNSTSYYVIDYQCLN
jgi:hypothetical protein